jgi:hypothetical protein
MPKIAPGFLICHVLTIFAISSSRHTPAMSNNRQRTTSATMRRVTSLQDLSSPAFVNNMTRVASVQEFRMPMDFDMAMTNNMPRVSSLKDLVLPVLLEVVRSEAPLRTSSSSYTSREERKDLMQALDEIDDLLCPFD